MTIDRRLHHAARELREVPIEVPPLSGLPHRSASRNGSRRPRLAVLAAPMLFVVGGLLTVGELQRQEPDSPHSDIPAAPTVVDAGPIPQGGPGDDPNAPSARDELQLIAGILDGRSDPTAAASHSPDAPVTTRVGRGPS